MRFNVQLLKRPVFPPTASVRYWVLIDSQNIYEYTLRSGDQSIKTILTITIYSFMTIHRQKRQETFFDTCIQVVHVADNSGFGEDKRNVSRLMKIANSRTCATSVNGRRPEEHLILFKRT